MKSDFESYQVMSFLTGDLIQFVPDTMTTFSQGENEHILHCRPDTLIYMGYFDGTKIDSELFSEFGSQTDTHGFYLVSKVATG